MTLEIWKDIPGCGGAYAVSNFGQVKSISRFVRGGKGKLQHVPERILKQTKDSYGYYVVSIRPNQSKSKVVKVHRLVLLAFVGDSAFMCCHSDGNPENNNLTNLRYGSAQDNANDRTNHGQIVGAIGEGNGAAKLTESAVREIKESLKSGNSQAKLAKAFGVCNESIRKIAIGKTWKHI